ncbi:collagen alpha-1(I) chain-like isoform X4 [Hordeum vulgare subsp. vulgare]|uniref:collagen alpha-1(I) chain-like isoform X4 n=1 Tax=Hordeum vulgare subsp. vulgare TaxID=112509 RepID=UPI001D1A37B3|nr:collagen alpha-1(I) chain-like isoform X4 [Hordeum vulgare subsp. vulgare]
MAMAGEGVGRCILVGLHMDAVGKELLKWALNQAARSGDRVVAVHIYRKSGDLCKTNALTLIRTLDEYLAEYEAICSKKDVHRPHRAGDAGELDPEGAGEGGQALRGHGGGDWHQQEVLLRRLDLPRQVLCQEAPADDQRRRHPGRQGHLRQGGPPAATWSRAQAGAPHAAAPERRHGAQGDHPQPQPAERAVHGLGRRGLRPVRRAAADEALRRRRQHCRCRCRCQGRRRARAGGARAEARLAVAPARARRVHGHGERARGDAQAVGGALGDEPAAAVVAVGVPGAGAGGAGGRAEADAGRRAVPVPVVPVRGAVRRHQPLLAGQPGGQGRAQQGVPRRPGERAAGGDQAVPGVGGGVQGLPPGGGHHHQAAARPHRAARRRLRRRPQPHLRLPLPPTRQPRGQPAREEVQAGAAVGEEVQGGGRGCRGSELRPLRRLPAGDPPRRQVLQHPPHGRLRASVVGFRARDLGAVQPVVPDAQRRRRHLRVPCAGVLHVREGDGQGGRVRVRGGAAGAPHRAETHHRRRLTKGPPPKSRHVGDSDPQRRRHLRPAGPEPGREARRGGGEADGRRGVALPRQIGAPQASHIADTEHTTGRRGRDEPGGLGAGLRGGRRDLPGGQREVAPWAGAA